MSVCCKDCVCMKLMSVAVQELDDLMHNSVLVFEGNFELG